MPSPNSTYTASRKQSVLIVDDEPAIREIVELYLGEEYAVTGAGSGELGVAEFDMQNFDVVISDRAMPGMSGQEFAAIIKERAPEMPIILTSGHRSAEVDPRLFCGFVPKPFTKLQLREAVRTAGMEAAQPQVTG